MSISCRIADDSFFSSLDTSINIPDHAVEFIVENLLGFTNAFPEIKDNKQQPPITYAQKISNFKLYSFTQKGDPPYFTSRILPKYSSLKVYPYFEYLLEINPPPPKLA